MNRLTRLALFLALAISLDAAQVSIGTVSKNAGQTANLSVLLANQGAQIAGVQFDLLYDATTLSITPTLGAAASAAGKSLSTNAVPGGVRVIIVGINQTLIADGSVTELSIQIAANAVAGNYPLTLANVFGADADSHSVAVSGVSGAVSVSGLVATYNVGDVYPFTADAAPSFGDSTMNILDLVQVLFAVNNIPGFRPAACSDRFDAMDLYPIDTTLLRGGDGLLDIRDLIRELFRVNNLDSDRPVRTSRGGVCASSADTMSAAGRAAPANSNSLQFRPARSQGTLLLGDPEKSGADEERVPLYLKTESGLARVAFTLALGDQHSALRFAASPETPPSLAPSGQMGVVALAWLEGVSVRAGDRILLGYVIGPAGVAPNLSLYGLSAIGLDDHREVPLDAPGVAGSRR